MSVAPGQLRRKRMLSTLAVYRVVSLDGALVVVEVVEAPGLSPGDRFRFTLDAVAEMELVRC